MEAAEDAGFLRAALAGVMRPPAGGGDACSPSARDAPGRRPCVGGGVMSSIFKEPVEGRVAVGPDGLDGDEQADLVFHGGPHKAVYAYAVQDTAWWEAELGRALGPVRSARTSP